MVADALADCEDYLRHLIAMNPNRSEADILSCVIDSVGPIQAVAEQCRAINDHVFAPFPTPTPPKSPGGLLSMVFGVVYDPRAYGALIYMLVSGMAGLFYVCALFSLGAVWQLVHVEGRIVEALLGVRMRRRMPAKRRWRTPGATLRPPAARRRRAPAAEAATRKERWAGSGQGFKNLTRKSQWKKLSAGLWVWIRREVLDRRVLCAAAYLMLVPPLGVTYFLIVAAGMSLPLGMAIGYLPGLPPLLNSVPGLTFLVIICIPLFVGTLHLSRLIGKWHGRMAEAMLVRPWSRERPTSRPEPNAPPLRISGP